MNPFDWVFLPCRAFKFGCSIVYFILEVILAYLVILIIYKAFEVLIDGKNVKEVISTLTTDELLYSFVIMVFLVVAFMIVLLVVDQFKAKFCGRTLHRRDIEAFTDEVRRALGLPSRDTRKTTCKCWVSCVDSMCGDEEESNSDSNAMEVLDQL